MEKTLSQILRRLDAIESRITKLESGESNSSKKKVIIRKNKSPSQPTKSINIKQGSIILTKHPNGCVLTGDTFDKKHIIKKYKGWWTPEVKGWTIRIENYKKIKQDLEKCCKSVLEKENDQELSIDTNFKKESNKQINTESLEGGFLSDSD